GVSLNAGRGCGWDTPQCSHQRRSRRRSLLAGDAGSRSEPARQGRERSKLRWKRGYAALDYEEWRRAGATELCAAFGERWGLGESESVAPIGSTAPPLGPYEPHAE